MIQRIVCQAHNILNHLKTRRNWNRTKRWMRERATSRAMTTILYQGRMRRRI